MQYLPWIERKYPGSLLNNSSYKLWLERYVSGAQAGGEAAPHPLDHQRPAEGPLQSKSWNHVSEWSLRVDLGGRYVVLFGCTEDVSCRSEDGHRRHAKDVCEGSWHCRTLCLQCTVPICSACKNGLQSFSPDANYSTVPK